MRKRDALKLRNRDEVTVRGATGAWEHGYVLGEPYEKNGRVIIPVDTPHEGYRKVDHVEVR